MAEFAVRYTQPLLGAANAAGYLVAVPGVSVLIRQDGVECDVYADNAKTPMDNPVPTGVPPGTAGVDTTGNLTVYLEPGRGYSAVATVGATSTTFAIPDISLDPLEPIPAAAVEEAMLGFDVATQTELTAGLATKAPATGIAQSAITNLVSDLAGKQPTIPPGTYVPVAGAVTKTGAITFDVPAGAEGAYKLKLAGPALPPGGARGIDLERESNGALGINLGSRTGGVLRNDWSIALDLEKTYPGSVNSHLVLAYDGVKSADVIRMSSGPHVEIANTAGAIGETFRLHLATYEGTSVAEHNTLTEMLRLSMAATSAATYFIRGFSAAEKFTVLRTGHIGVNLNGATPTAPFHCVAAGDAIKLDRGGTADTAWAAWTQGSGVGDWRMGMESGSSDLMVFAANGDTPTPSAPGTARLRMTQAGVTTLFASAINFAPAAGGAATVAISPSAAAMRLAGITNLANTGGYVDIANGVAVIGRTTTQATLIVQPVASQTVDILRIATSASLTAVSSRFDKLGRLGLRTVAAPLDVDVATSEMFLWLDDTNGAGKLMVKAKTANGTVVVGSLALA